MNSLIDIKKHSSLILTNEISQITNPLLKHNTSYFCFVRIFKDRSRICLTNNAAWHTHFCTDRQYIKDAFEQPISEYDNSTLTWSSIANTDIESDLSVNFNVIPTVTVIEKGNHFCDFYHYGSPANNYKANSSDNIEDLERFVFSFKDKANSLIHNSDLIVFPEWQNFQSLEKTSSLSTPALDINKYLFNDGKICTYLTKKEIECLKLIVRGKSADEIALIFNLSRRTVESHIDNMKQKFNCVKVAQLIYKISSSRLFYKLLSEEINF